MRDILAQLARPGRDPREDLPAPVFKQGVLKLEDLTPGMELTGTVLNVVDFGCFVDIGMHDGGLVHVHPLGQSLQIRNPHEMVAVGNVVEVWVMEVDKERRRVSLTMVRPGSERPRRPVRAKGMLPHRPSKPARIRRVRTRPVMTRQGGATGRSSARGGQGRPGGRGDGQQGQQPTQQGGRPQGGRPQGGRSDQGRRPQRAGAPPQGGRRRARRHGRRAPRRTSRLWWSSQRRPRPQGADQGQPHEFKRKPKPMIPITEDMKKGKEPMRTFGDLMQFFVAETDEKDPPLPKRKEQDEQRKRAGAPAVTDLRRGLRQRAGRPLTGSRRRGRSVPVTEKFLARAA